MSGTLGSALNVRLESRDLNDVMPAMTIVGEIPVKLPFTLEQNGSALFEGTVDGPLKTRSCRRRVDPDELRGAEAADRQACRKSDRHIDGRADFEFRTGTGQATSGGIGGSRAAELEAYGRVGHQGQREAAGS